jgi:hypothetical protein
MPNLSISGFYGMVFKHFQNCFHLKSFVNGFLQLFQLCFHIAQGHIPCQIAHILGVACVLAIIKPLGGVLPIIVREVLYQFTSHALCF